MLGLHKLGKVIIALNTLFIDLIVRLNQEVPERMEVKFLLLYFYLCAMLLQMYPRTQELVMLEKGVSGPNMRQKWGVSIKLRTLMGETRKD